MQTSRDFKLKMKGVEGLESSLSSLFHSSHSLANILTASSKWANTFFSLIFQIASVAYKGFSTRMTWGGGGGNTGGRVRKEIVLDGARQDMSVSLKLSGDASDLTF